MFILWCLYIIIRYYLILSAASSCLTEWLPHHVCSLQQLARADIISVWQMRKLNLRFIRFQRWKRSWRSFYPAFSFYRKKEADQPPVPQGVSSACSTWVFWFLGQQFFHTTTLPAVLRVLKETTEGHLGGSGHEASACGSGHGLRVPAQDLLFLLALPLPLLMLFLFLSLSNK